MTDISIDESGLKLISASVSDALGPKFDDIHGRVTAVATSVSNIDGRLESMATKEDLAKLRGAMATKGDIEAHACSCESRRRWSIGLFIGIPAMLVSILALFSAIHGCSPQITTVDASQDDAAAQNSDDTD